MIGKQSLQGVHNKASLPYKWQFVTTSLELSPRGPELIRVAQFNCEISVSPGAHRNLKPHRWGSQQTGRQAEEPLSEVDLGSRREMQM